MFQLVYPPCFQRAGRTQTALYESSVSPFVWTSCAENGCSTFFLNQQSVGGRRIEACGSLSVYVSHRTCQFLGSTATKSISVLHSRINHFSGWLKVSILHHWTLSIVQSSCPRQGRWSRKIALLWYRDPYISVRPLLTSNMSTSVSQYLARYSVHLI